MAGKTPSAGLVLPALHHLFCRPAPRVVARLADGRARWVCSCGACWDE